MKSDFDNLALEFDELIEKWLYLIDYKCMYVNGDEPFEKEYFTQTVKDTFQAIRQFKNYCRSIEKFAKEIDDNLYGFSYSLAKISEYAAEISCCDESEQFIFSASQAIARLLIDYATTFARIIPTDETGVLYGNTETCWGGYWPDKEGLDFDDCVEYNTSTGDMSKIIEVAKRVNS